MTKNSSRSWREEFAFAFQRAWVTMWWDRKCLYFSIITSELLLKAQNELGFARNGCVMKAAWVSIATVTLQIKISSKLFVWKSSLIFRSLVVTFSSLFNMSSYKRDFVDPKQINERWQLLLQRNLKSDLKRHNSICLLNRPENSARGENHHRTQSVIDIPSSNAWAGMPSVKGDLSLSENERIIRSCQSDNEALSKSMTNGKSRNGLPEDLIGMTKACRTTASQNVIQSRSLFNGDVSSNLSFIALQQTSTKDSRSDTISKTTCDCYESRMFNFPYINQIAPRLPPLLSSRPSSKTTVSEYTDEIGRIGRLIFKYNLHNHSKCGKQGRKCEHIMTVDKKWISWKEAALKLRTLRFELPTVTFSVNLNFFH